MRASSAMGGPINEMPTGQPSKVAPGRFICGNPVSLQYLREMTLRHLGGIPEPLSRTAVHRPVRCGAAWALAR